MLQRLRVSRRMLSVGLAVSLAVGALSATTTTAQAAVTPVLNAPLHTNGVDSTIYDAANKPVRLVGFNWAGTEQGGRNDAQKIADVCGITWHTPLDQINGITYDNMYQVLHDLGYNVIRLPISWNNLEPTAPIWSATLNQYVRTFSTAYVNDLKSMVSKARAAGLSVILDMHQDFWSPALHHITNWNGTPGYCEGVGMPRWLDPSIDAKATTTQNTDFYNGMNWFFRNIHDPLATNLSHASPWGLFYSIWDWLSYSFSVRSGYPDYQAIIGADLINEPYYAYVGGNPPAGQTVLQASGARLKSFYQAIAPAVTNWNPNWLLFFADSTGGYNTAHPDWRETPTMTAKPAVPGNWVYSMHIYNTTYGTFNDGVTTHDDLGLNVSNAALANAKSWKVPLYMGEFTNFNTGVDARTLTDAQTGETRKFVAWAKQNNVSWTFWAYMATYTVTTMINYTNNSLILPVYRALASGL